MTPTQFLLFAAALTSVILADVTSASPSQHRPFTIASSPSRKAGGEADGGEAVSEVSSVVECPTRHYYSQDSMACRPCSPCPVNLIIRAPCSARHDTRCGPFFEFDKFHQSPVQPSPAGDGPHTGGRHPGRVCFCCFRSGAGIIEADDRQVTTVFTVQPSFHHRHSTNRVSRIVIVVGERRGEV